MAQRNLKWWHRAVQNPVGGQGAHGQQTQYVDEYREYDFNPVTSFRPNRSYKAPMNPMDGKSTFSADYQPYEVKKHELRPKLPYIPPSQTMATQSMYSHEYAGKSGAPALSVRPKHQRPSNVKFEAVPTYAHDYRAHAANKPLKHGPVRSWAPPEQKMDIMSTARQDYDGKVAPRQQSFAPVRRAVMSDQPMDGDTTQRHDFVPHALEPRFSKAKRVYEPPTVPMDGTTTQRQSFNEKERSIRESLRPARSYPASTDPMAGSSEARDRYIAWPVSKPDRRQPLKYEKPQGGFEMTTTTGSDYVETGGLPARAIRPQNRPQGGGQFEGSTNYSADFRVWPMMREKVKVSRTYAPPEVPFDGATTFNQEYKGYNGALPSQSCRPERKLNRSQQPMDGETMYTTSYVPKTLEHSVRYPTPEWMKQREVGRSCA